MRELGVLRLSRCALVPSLGGVLQGYVNMHACHAGMHIERCLPHGTLEASGQGL